MNISIYEKCIKWGLTTRKDGFKKLLNYRNQVVENFEPYFGYE